MKRKRISKNFTKGLQKIDNSLQFALFGKKINGETIRDCNPIQVEKYEKIQVIARKPIYYLMYNTELTKTMLDHINEMYLVEKVELSYTFANNVRLVLECLGYRMTYTFNIKNNSYYKTNCYYDVANIEIMKIN